MKGLAGGLHDRQERSRLLLGGPLMAFAVWAVATKHALDHAITFANLRPFPCEISFEALLLGPRGLLQQPVDLGSLWDGDLDRLALLGLGLLRRLALVGHADRG